MSHCTAVCEPSAVPPVISSFSGPTTLKVNETGTWTVKATDPLNGTLMYSVYWGDDPEANSLRGGVRSKPEQWVQTPTFTHAYANAGTYTVSVSVRGASGYQANTSTTVKVEASP
jgi:PKD domain-containing protein